MSKLSKVNGTKSSAAPAPLQSPSSHSQDSLFDDDERIDWAQFCATVSSVSIATSSPDALKATETFTKLTSSNHPFDLLQLLGLNDTHWFSSFGSDNFGLEKVVRYSALLLLKRDFEIASRPLPFVNKRADDLNEAVSEVITLPFLMDLYRLDGEGVEQEWQNDTAKRRNGWSTSAC